MCVAFTRIGGGGVEECRNMVFSQFATDLRLNSVGGLVGHCRTNHAIRLSPFLFDHPRP